MLIGNVMLRQKQITYVPQKPIMFHVYTRSLAVNTDFEVVHFNLLCVILVAFFS